MGRGVIDRLSALHLGMVSCAAPRWTGYHEEVRSVGMYSSCVQDEHSVLDEIKDELLYSRAEFAEGDNRASG
jgi:hypothetical protein